MQLSQTQTVKQQPHLFSLKQQNLDCYYIGVTHSFQTETTLTSNTTDPISPTIISAFPVFNNDQQFFTPSFVLTLDINYYISNGEFEKQKFGGKLEHAMHQISNSNLHLIHPSVNFCQICKCSYEDYHMHVSEKSHSKLLTQSKGNRYIQQLCTTRLRKHKLIVKQDKGHQLKDQKVTNVRVKKKQCFQKDEALINHQSKLTNQSTQQISP